MVFGRVYILKCKGQYYYGSTIQILIARFRTHKKDCKIEYFTQQGWDNVEIELIQEGEFENIQALRRCEGAYILEHITDENCLNKYVAGRTRAESNKAYREINRDALIIRCKNYHTLHKAENNAKARLYKEHHKDELKTKRLAKKAT